MPETPKRKSMKDMTIEEFKAYVKTPEYQRIMESGLTASERRQAARARANPMTPEAFAKMLADSEASMTESDRKWHQYIVEMEECLDDETGQTPEPKMYWLKDDEPN